MLEFELNLVVPKSFEVPAIEEVVEKEIVKQEENKIDLVDEQSTRSKTLQLELPEEKELKELKMIKGIDINDNLVSKEINPTLLQKGEVDENEESILIELKSDILVSKLQLTTLTDLLSKDGDTVIYIKYGTNTRRMGMAASDRIYRIILPVMKTMFGDDATVFKKNGTKYKKYSENDMSVLRINMK